VSKPARGAARKTAPARQPAAKPPERRGVPRTGRIVTMVLGQGHGFIRLPSHRNVFFHRSDVRDGTSFSELSEGQSVRFELLEDEVSGPRALHVERRKR
jgi:cold shock CspA family protein